MLLVEWSTTNSKLTFSVLERITVVIPISYNDQFNIIQINLLLEIILFLLLCFSFWFGYNYDVSKV